jgi:hypothetical protein
MYGFSPGTSSTSLEAGLEQIDCSWTSLSQDISRKARWILKQRHNADFEVYAKQNLTSCTLN